jgi:phosphate transport system substrate-binding protein
MKINVLSWFGWVAWLALVPAAQVHAQAVTGAGSSAAAPIYRVWAREYQKSTGVTLVYESIGSSAGLRKIRSGQAGFGASDIAPSEAELASDRLVAFPVAITGIAPVVNLPKLGDGQLRLTGDLLARIYLGEVNRWSAPEIRQLNPGLALPDMPIRVVARADGSGTTFNFTDYLSKQNATWKSQFGAKASIAWPAATLTAKGSEGVVTTVRDTVGAIGYVDHGYVAENKLASVQMRNQDGEFVRSGPISFQSALANSDWAARGAFTTTLTDRPGRGSWPITMGTFVVVPRVSDPSGQTLAALRFVVWAFNHGDALVQQASFVRLPNRVQAAAVKVISGVQDPSGKPIGLSLF